MRLRTAAVSLSVMFLLVYITLYLRIHAMFSHVRDEDFSLPPRARPNSFGQGGVLPPVESPVQDGGDAAPIALHDLSNVSSWKALRDPGYRSLREATHRRDLETLRRITAASELREFAEGLLNDTARLVEVAGSPWAVAAGWVQSRAVLPARAPQLGALLFAMATEKVTRADVGYQGTQLKATLLLEGGQRVSFRPQKYARDKVIKGTPYAGYDRHNGEIAAFHLGRILGLRRIPVAVGRRINLTSELMPVAELRLLETFLVKGDNVCFYGKCGPCRPETAACGVGSVMEGAVTLWLPKNWPLKKRLWHPWKRTYNVNKTARWQTDQDYCNIVRSSPLYKSGPMLLDLIDASVLDYLIGNADRHMCEMFAGWEDSMVVLLDNGKSFGDPDKDEVTILAPLYQCCIMRRSTWQQLSWLTGGMLGSLLRMLLGYDAITPVLTDAHYRAVDRRLKAILTIVDTCIRTHGRASVLVTDAAQ
ncbi:PREDICTED: glycosaminoglycan xylosylkinase-like [Priapulus caudatus]|uniref:Glycosaminoglycan xylosylkinase-like n=1 Tax=Priapulus caudatus TaxID=37621 RepID=A0ABM1DVA5_PRICU|nr:PREDICTED: glycosaminoglycan xylosylkinase-like [Priapulus caudatus]